MDKEGPDLATLLRRLSECPEEFIQVAGAERGGHVVSAIIADYFRDFGPANPVDDYRFFEFLQATKTNPQQVRFLGMLSVAVWLLHDPWFLERPELVKASWQFLQNAGLLRLSTLVKTEHTVSDPDRREEFARFCLSHIGLRPKGESLATASDRLASLNSIERKRILQETADAEKRAREIREAMAAAKAQEAASRYGE